MNSGDYDQYILHKYRLAVAIAVIKTKPNNRNVDEHLNLLKAKINHNDDIDDDITICDEDFNINDSDLAIDFNESNDSVTILKNFDFTSLGAVKTTDNDEFLDVMRILDDITDDKIEVDKLNTQSTNCEESQNTQNLINKEIYVTLSQRTDNNKNEPPYNVTSLTNNLDSQETEIYDIQNYIEYTHISQSQDNLIVSKNLIINNNKANETNKIINDNNDSIIAKDNDKRKNDSIDETEAKRAKNDLKTSQDKISNEFLTQFSSTFDKSTELSNNRLINDFDNSGNYQDNEIKILSKDLTKNISLSEFEYNTQSLSVEKTQDIDNFHNKNNNLNDTFDNNDNSDTSTEDLTASQVEMVTFKVLEELSKVKSYLSRRERTKSDSGYRSYQARCSGESASQNTNSWINESAHCLLNCIVSSPLVTSTVEITEEISKVLGKLIDSLHEDEIYPNFLEDILGRVESLLSNVYEGRNYGENILNTDESIQRVYLLNRSIHITKYTIDKITNILQVTLENLNENYELRNTDKSENICYIFNILEDLIKRHNKYKNISSQTSSQLSQDEKVLKKSSLTEIWRRKWNLSRNEVFEGSSEKICVLSKCRDVLNKIIVQAMDGYSLISFSALQCFNLLQN